MHITKLRALALLAITIGICGCGGTGANLDVHGSQTPATQPNILTQPASQSIPMGLKATFVVGADGSPSVAYQWSENGAPIGGATSDTYTTPALTLADTGSIFTVSVSNSAGSVTSDAVTLTVTARAPEAGDLRFQQVDAASTVNGYGGGGENTLISGGQGVSFGSAIGTPLSMGGPSCGTPGDFGPLGACSWFFSSFGLRTGVTGLGIAYQQYYFEDLETQLATWSSPNTVVTSLDLEPGPDDTFAASWIQTSQPGGFNMAQNTVDASDLAAAAAQEGAESRVITAISYDAGQVFYLSYGWTGDTTTVYETQVATATIDTVGSVAANLAAQGYIITAFGGTLQNGFLLVGTRVQGDTAPRPILVVPLNGNLDQLVQQGYAIVGVAYEFNSSYLFAAETTIGER